MSESRKNRFPGGCAVCNAHVGRYEGTIRQVGEKWQTYCAAHADQQVMELAPPPAHTSPAPYEVVREMKTTPVEELWPDLPKATKSHKTAAEKIAAALAEIESPIDETRVIELIKEHAAPQTQTIYRDKIVVVANEERHELPEAPRHEIFPDVLAAIAAGLNVALVGPAGCGKTELCGQVAEALGLRFGHTGAVGTKYDLSGYKDANGNYQANCELPDFVENGGLFLFDELDGSVPNAVLFTNTLLANGSVAFPHRTIHKHEDFRAIAAMNTYGTGATPEYVGRNPLDVASKDRYVVIPMDYDEQLERDLFGDTEWTAYVQKFRKAVRTLKIRHVVSMRAIAQGKKLIAAGISRDKVELYVLYKGLDAAEVAKIKRNMEQ